MPVRYLFAHEITNFVGLSGRVPDSYFIDIPGKRHSEAVFADKPSNRKPGIRSTTQCLIDVGRAMTVHVQGIPYPTFHRGDMIPASGMQ